MMRIPLALVVAALVSGCASARSHEPTRGAFDSDDGDTAYGGVAGSDAPMAVSEVSADEERGGFLDSFLGGSASKEAEAPPPGPPPPPSRMARAPSAEPAPAPGESAGAVSEQAEGSNGAEPSVVVPGARLMIYTGAATVLVPSVQEAQEKLTARVEGLGGYVQSATGDTSSNNSTITYRVPVAKFFEVKKELATYGQVLNDTVQAEDVTKQVFDLEIRLDTATRSRERLVELLKQATKMEDILQIEAEMRRLTDEIEALKGQLRFLKDRVSFSTLTVSLYSNAPPPVTGPRRTRSRFDWINQVGPEKVLNEF